MPQNESKDQPQNGTATSNKTEDVVDAEFTELGDNPIPSSQTTWEQSRPHRQYTWSSVLVGCVGIALIYFVFFHQRAAIPNLPTVPGWDELARCSYMTSLDGTKELTLSDDHRAAFSDNSRARNQKGEGVNILGSWSFDESSKLYSVTLNDETTIYILLSPERSNGCLLIKGDIQAADLRASWFSSTSDDDPDDYEYRDRPTPGL